MDKMIFLTPVFFVLFFSCKGFADSSKVDAFQQSSAFSHERSLYEPQIPNVLLNLKKSILSVKREASFDPMAAHCFCEQIRSESNVYLFGKTTVDRATFHPLRVGVVFSGGPAPGGHAVVSGLVDALAELHPDSQCIGFLNGLREFFVMMPGS